MNSYLDELYAHQEWADAEHWRAFEAHPAALADKAIRERLLHIHLVQHAFLWVTGPRTSEFAFKKLEDFPTMADLKQYARQLPHGGRRVAQGIGSESNSRNLSKLPWFKPPVKISRASCV